MQDAPVGGGRLVPINYALEDTNLLFDNIWCYKKGSDFKRNLAITRDLEKAFIKKEGLSILDPELVLLYKSTAPNNPDYRHDFDVVIDKLDEERYKWFLGAMQTAYPTGHPWLKQILIV